jgi:hypothetical protein
MAIPALNEVNEVTMNTVIATFKNEVEGMTSFVTYGEKGYYHVSLKDDNSGMFLPIALIYPTEELAKRKAKEIISDENLIVFVTV